MMKCRLECRSTRNSILPPLMSLTALVTLAVTVPVFGFGMRPRGPRTLPSLPTLPIMSGVATTASKSSHPPLILSMSSSPPTTSAPAASASAALSPVAKTRTRAVLPVPWGRLTVPRTIWSALRGSTPRRMATSTVSSNFFLLPLFASLIAAIGENSSSWSNDSDAARYVLLRCMSGSSVLLGLALLGLAPLGLTLLDWPAVVFGAQARPCHGFCVRVPDRLRSVGRDAHRAGGALDDLHRRVDVVGVEVGQLGRGDLAHLVLGQLADLLLVRDTRPLLQTCRLLDHLSRRRRLGDERERTVFVDRDLNGDDVAPHGLGLRVIGLAELHDVDAVGTESGTHRRCRSGRPGLQLHLDERCHLLLGRHVSLGPYVM